VYAALWCKSNFSFLEGASHAEELVEEATGSACARSPTDDRDGVYGMVRAHVKARELGVQLGVARSSRVAHRPRCSPLGPVSVPFRCQFR